MKLNARKTKTLIVSRSRTMHPQSPALTIGKTVLKESDDLVILGVTIDSKMTLENHLRSVSRAASQWLCSRLNGTLSYLNRVKNILDQKSRILQINALIFSHLNYCSSIWAKCSGKTAV